MAQSPAASADHGSLMDSIYRGQRHIYDATRKYYLFGRDRMIKGLDMPAGSNVLEIGCGTGRNLALIARQWPGARLFGLDISAEMLKSAAAKLGLGATLAQGDAIQFEPIALFGQAQFDRVVLSFTTSMIPDWLAAIDQAAACIAPDGSLHLVDFGEMAGLPAPLRSVLKTWLTKFHVTPRPYLIECARRVAAERSLSLQATQGPGGYYVLLTMRRKV